MIAIDQELSPQPLKGWLDVLNAELTLYMCDDMNIHLPLKSFFFNPCLVFVCKRVFVAVVLKVCTRNQYLLTSSDTETNLLNRDQRTQAETLDQYFLLFGNRS